jgi:hypothetical protein
MYDVLRGHQEQGGLAMYEAIFRVKDRDGNQATVSYRCLEHAYDGGVVVECEDEELGFDIWETLNSGGMRRLRGFAMWCHAESHARTFPWIEHVLRSAANAVGGGIDEVELIQPLPEEAFGDQEYATRMMRHCSRNVDVPPTQDEFPSPHLAPPW